MEVKEFQRKIVEFADKWDRKRNVIPNTHSNFIHLVEEIGELAHEYVSEEKRKDKFSKEKLENAIGDILLQTVELAHLHGMDIEELVLKIINDEEQRVT